MTEKPNKAARPRGKANRAKSAASTNVVKRKQQQKGHENKSGVSRAERNCNWLEKYCIVPDGKDVRKRLKLRPWQKDIVRGIYDGKTRRAICSFGRKNGKGLALDTPIPTPDGWRTMADIQAGDYVFGADGHPTRVLLASDVHHGLRCWRLTFSDGSSIVADEQHRWLTHHSYRPWAGARVNGSGAGGRWRQEVVTTPQIADSVTRPTGSGHNHKIDIAPATVSPNISLPIDPYVLGAWLGDGTSASGTFTCAEGDLPHFLTQLREVLGDTVYANRVTGKSPTIRTPKTGLQSCLREAGVLGSKRIPSVYFDAGTAQRWALLQGLMDTDGTVTKGRNTPRASFCNTNLALATSVWRLARSLGLKATLKRGEAKLNGRVIGAKWSVAFTATKDQPVFSLPRKQELLADTMASRSRTLSITACEEVASVPTKCLMVGAADSLFLAGEGCVPTHNTALAAALLLLHLVGHERRQNSELYSTALSRDQAAITFKLAAKMVRLSPVLSELVTVRDTVKQLYCGRYGTLYSALSADASTAMGLSPVFVIHDELGQVKGPRHPLYEALETATGAQEYPLSIVISTQAPTDGDLLSILIDDALEENDPKTRLFLYTAADNESDPFSEETIRQANPAFGDFQNAEEVLAMADAAKRMPAREAEYRNLILNQRVEASNPFVAQSVWQANAEPPEGWGIVYGGLDLSETNDLTALILVSPHRGQWGVKSIFWLPEEGLEERARKDRVPYDVWANQGFLNTTPGKSVEYEYIARYLADLFQNHDIRKIAFDRWNMRHLKPWLVNAGMPESMIEDRFVDFGQGYQSMSPALRTLESLLLNGKLRHGAHPVLTMCAANAVVKSDEAGGRKLDKKRSRGRIDGLVSLCMACAVASEDQHEKAVYPVDVNSIVEDLTA